MSRSIEAPWDQSRVDTAQKIAQSWKDEQVRGKYGHERHESIYRLGSLRYSVDGASKFTGRVFKDDNRGAQSRGLEYSAGTEQSSIVDSPKRKRKRSHIVSTFHGQKATDKCRKSTSYALAQTVLL